MGKLTGLVLAMIALSAVSLAMETEGKMTLAALLEMRAQASGAIDTVLNLLEDLRKASLNERAELEERNKTWEKEGTSLLAELTRILNINEKNYQDAVTHRQFIEKEIEDTEGHLAWIEKRLSDIARKLAELKVQRCKANHIFVNALKEHNDALKAVRILQDEIKSLHAKGELAEISSLTEKFKAYEHLFEAEAVNSFLELAKGKGVDNIHGQEDNKKGALKLQGMSTNPDQRNLKGTLAEKVLSMLLDLTKHLHESMKNLEEHEIQASYDYADFKAASEIENATLVADHARKEKYIAKLEIDVEVARESEDRCLSIRDESQIAVDGATTDLEVKRAFYAQESARIQEDLSTIEQVIVVFKDKVVSMQGVLKQRIDEYQDGEKMTHVDRRAEDIQARDSGRLGQIVQGK